MMQLRAPSRVLVPLGLAVCLSLFGDLTLYAVLVTQLDEVGLSLAAVGVMLGVNRLIRIPGNPPAGVLLDRWGRRQLFIFITQFAGEGVVFSTISLLLQQRFGQNVALGSLALGVASASGALLGLRSLLASAVGPLAGHLSDAYTGRWPVIVGSLVVGIVGFGLLSFATSPGTIVLGVTLGAVSGGAALATLAAQVGDLTPPGREGVVMGAYATAGDVGSMAGPFLAFALLSVVDLRWIYLLCTFTFLVGLCLIWRSRGVQFCKSAPES